MVLWQTEESVGFSKSDHGRFFKLGLTQFDVYFVCRMIKFKVIKGLYLGISAVLLLFLKLSISNFDLGIRK